MDYEIKDQVLVKVDKFTEEDTFVIPDGVVEIDEWFFSRASRLKKVVIPDTVEEIGYGAFNDSAIESIVIPDSVTKISRNAFQKCEKLRSAVIGKGVTVLPEEAFLGCDHLQWIELPETLEKIGEGAYYGCYSLVEVRVNGETYPVRAKPAPLPVKLTFQSLEQSKKEEMDYLSKATWMDEFEYIDYCITGGDYYNY